MEFTFNSPNGDSYSLGMSAIPHQLNRIAWSNTWSVREESEIGTTTAVIAWIEPVKTDIFWFVNTAIECKK